MGTALFPTVRAFQQVFGSPLLRPNQLYVPAASLALARFILPADSTSDPSPQELQPSLHEIRDPNQELFSYLMAGRKRSGKGKRAEGSHPRFPGDLPRNLRHKIQSKDFQGITDADLVEVLYVMDPRMKRGDTVADYFVLLNWLGGQAVRPEVQEHITQMMMGAIHFLTSPKAPTEESPAPESEQILPAMNQALKQGDYHRVLDLSIHAAASGDTELIDSMLRHPHALIRHYASYAKLYGAYLTGDAAAMEHLWQLEKHLSVKDTASQSPIRHIYALTTLDFFAEKGFDEALALIEHWAESGHPSLSYVASYYLNAMQHRNAQKADDDTPEKTQRPSFEALLQSVQELDEMMKTFEQQSDKRLQHMETDQLMGQLATTLRSRRVDVGRALTIIGMLLTKEGDAVVPSLVALNHPVIDLATFLIQLRRMSQSAVMERWNEVKEDLVRLWKSDGSAVDNEESHFMISAFAACGVDEARLLLQADDSN